MICFAIESEFKERKESRSLPQPQSDVSIEAGMLLLTCIDPHFNDDRGVIKVARLGP